MEPHLFPQNLRVLPKSRCVTKLDMRFSNNTELLLYTRAQLFDAHTKINQLQLQNTVTSDRSERTGRKKKPTRNEKSLLPMGSLSLREISVNLNLSSSTTATSAKNTLKGLAPPRRQTHRKSKMRQTIVREGPGSTMVDCMVTLVIQESWTHGF